MVTLVDETALMLWAEEGMEKELGNPYPANSIEWSLRSMKEIRALEGKINFSERHPLHVLVDSDRQRVASSCVVSHVWTGRFPPGSLYRLGHGTLIASPGFCCLLVAGRHSLARTACVEMECLGLYGRVPTSRGFLDREPLLSKESLGTYLKGATGSYGVSSARKAMRCALENSRSPMETKTVLMLTLPPKLGGYGLPRPKLNHTILPIPNDYPVSQYATYLVDACWERRRVVYEFNSYSEHLSESSLDSDAMKMNSLGAMGWTARVVTPAQLSGDSLDVLARQLARALGVKARQPTPEKRDELLAELL